MNTPRPDPKAAIACEQMRARASACFERADRFALHFARSKLKSDPLYTDVLVSGALSGCRDLVDLGCGQGLLSAWLLAARVQRRLGPWPPSWPEPPDLRRMRGVDLRAASIRRARAALGERARFLVQDIRAADCSGADAVALLDVLHFIDYAEQQQRLASIRAGLPRDGVLILRIADAASGFSYRLARWIDRLNDLVRDGRIPRISCRSVPDWLELLHDCGFEAHAHDQSSGRSFANTLLIARAA